MTHHAFSPTWRIAGAACHDAGMVRTPPEEYDAGLASLTLDEIAGFCRARGWREVLLKRLADQQEDDKNEIYVGGDFTQVS